MKIKYTWDKSTGARTWWAKISSEQHQQLINELERISEWVMEHSCDPKGLVWTVFTSRDQDIWGRAGHHRGRINCALSRLGGLLNKAKRQRGDWSYDQFASLEKILTLAHELASDRFEKYHFHESGTDVKDINTDLFEF